VLKFNNLLTINIMKSKITKQDKSFKPFTIEIMVESLDETRDLWHRFSFNDLDKRTEQYTKELALPSREVNNFKLWDLIDEELKAQGFK